jgi:excisionase family DNA binding protein
MSMPIQSSSPIFTLSEAATFLGLSIESVRKYVQKKRIKPTATIGRAYLFSRDECERFRPTIKPPGNPTFQRKKRAVARRQK